MREIATSVAAGHFLLDHRYRIHGLTPGGRFCEAGSPEAFVSWDWIALPG